MHTATLTPLTLAGLARCAAGRLVGPDRVVGAISIDSRSLQPGALFVALGGERNDGHDFARAAAERGACGLLVERELPIDIPQVVVSNSLEALTACARAQRQLFSGPVVGITGSNGKTTTKEMIGAILSGIGTCLVTKGNLNNHIGVPLTLMELRQEHRFAVIEMGANHAGEIAHLASIAKPTVGLVTNAGPAHLEGFGSVEGVAAGKGELFAGLSANGVAVVNADDRFATTWRALAGSRRVITFGIDQPADFTARAVQSSIGEKGPETTFDLVSPLGSAYVSLKLGGLHNLRNALGAAAATSAAGARLSEIARGLGSVVPFKGRFELKAGINGAFLVDDTYNANPGSLKAGLDAFSSFTKTRWLVLGDMMELGPTADELHADVGRHAKAAGVTRLLAFGPRAKFAAEAFGEGGCSFDNIDDLIAEARKSLTPDVIVLVKGSRVNRLERVTAALAASQ
jgi:UDP-N-acetylmuramoyl-tripeptide--D-alanyl-D-alanine ligase